MARLLVGMRVDKLRVINPIAGSVVKPPMPIRSIEGLFVPSFFSNCGNCLIMINPSSAGMAATMNVHLQLLTASINPPRIGPATVQIVTLAAQYPKAIGLLFP